MNTNTRTTNNKPFVTVDEFDVANIEFNPPSKTSFGTVIKPMYRMPNGQLRPLSIRMPKLSTNGLVEFVSDNGRSRYSFFLSFSTEGETEKRQATIEKAMQKLHDFDTMVTKHMFDNGMASEFEVVPTMRPSDTFADSINVKLPNRVPAYDFNDNPVNYHNALVPGCNVIVVMECTGLWLSSQNGTCRSSWQAKYLKIGRGDTTFSDVKVAVESDEEEEEPKPKRVRKY